MKLKPRSLGASRIMYTEDELTDLYMDIIDIIGKNYDGTLDKASNVAEQITFKIEELAEGVYERQEELKGLDE